MLNLILYFAMLIKVLVKFLLILAQLSLATGECILGCTPKLFWILFLSVYRKMVCVYFVVVMGTIKYIDIVHETVSKCLLSRPSWSWRQVCLLLSILRSHCMYVGFGKLFLGHRGRHRHEYSCRIVFLPSKNALESSNVRLNQLTCVMHSDGSVTLVQTPWLTH